MLKAAALALPALLFAASCSPQAPVKTSQEIPPAAPVRNPATLLEKLALDVPDGVVEEAAIADTRRASALAAPAFDTSVQSGDDAARALDCLTSAIYYEARSEPLDGERAVAQVVLNRVRDRAFPKTVCGVVYQGSTRRTGCQFSFTCDGSMLRPRDPASWERSRLVAANALAGDVYAPVGSATHYHASYVSPWWAPSLTRIGAVGSHIFYRWRTGMENALAFRQRYEGGEPDMTWGAVAGDIAGVTVHRGGDGLAAADISVGSGADTTNGVTVHRGGSGSGSSGAAGMTPATSFRPSTVSGVRVHRDVGTPSGGAQGDAVTDDESGPI